MSLEEEILEVRVEYSKKLSYYIKLYADRVSKLKELKIDEGMFDLVSDDFNKSKRRIEATLIADYEYLLNKYRMPSCPLYKEVSTEIAHYHGAPDVFRR